MAKTSTGYVYSPEMEDYHCLWDESYVENPQRLSSVVARCKELGLLERCKKIESRNATTEEMLLCHTQELLDKLEQSASMNEEELKSLSSQFDCLYIHPNSWKAAKLSAGSCLDLCKAVVSGQVDNGMALVRPPGHHASSNESCGYCYVNNVAIAARSCLNSGLERILIVDWDVHHGQATQREFYNDNRVLYISIHRFEYGAWWPNLKESNFDHIGKKEGKGFNVNIPLNRVGNTNSDYLGAWHEIVLPLAHEFDPQLVLISAGFDPAIGCPEGEQKVTPACFAHFTKSLLGLAGGKVCAFLEGGYYLSSLAESAALTLRTLIGDPVPGLVEPLTIPCGEMAEAIRNVKICLAPFWQCFKGFEDQELTKTKWEGPETPQVAPFDIYCPTPARSEQEEQRFAMIFDMIVHCTKLVTFPNTFFLTKDAASEELTTSLESCQVGCLTDGISSVISLESQVLITKEEQQLVNLMESCPQWQGAKRLFVDCSNSQDWQCRLVAKGNSVKVGIKDVLSDQRLIFQKLVPSSYNFNPDVVILYGLDSIDEDQVPVLKMVLQQLRSLAQGRIMIGVDKDNLIHAMADIYLRA